MQEAMTNMNETIFTYLKLNVKSQEMFKVNIQNNAFSNKSEEYQKSKRKRNRARLLINLKRVDGMLMI